MVNSKIGHKPRREYHLFFIAVAAWIRTQTQRTRSGALRRPPSFGFTDGDSYNSSILSLMGNR